MNQIIIVGNLGNDPEIKHFEGDNMVANFNVAVAERYKKGTEVVETTEWFRCVAWNKTAKFIETHTRKGNKVLITGKMKSREYEKDGVKRYITEIHVDRIDQLTWPEKTEEFARQSSPSPTSIPQGGDDLPF